MAAGSKTQPPSVGGHPCRLVARSADPHGRPLGSVAGGPGKGREVVSNGDGVVY
jgi:hypothetical protein